MAEDSTFHGWTISHGKSATGKPRVTFTKPGRATVYVDRRVGTDAAVALQRGKVTIMEQEVAEATPDDRSLWQGRLDKAIEERDRAREERVAAAAIAAKYGGG
jgi:hypothetical protein